MSFNLAKKNRPQLTDYNYLQKIVENKKVEETIVEPSLFGKIYEKIKSNFYKFIEDNIFYTFIFVCIICFLIYRYLQYQTRKNTNNIQDSIIMDEHFQLSIKRVSDNNSDDNNRLEKKLKNKLKRKQKKVRKLEVKQKYKETNDDIYTIHEETEKSNSCKDNIIGDIRDIGNTNNQNIPENMIYDEQHIKQIPELLKATKDRELKVINTHHSLINSSSYIPYNLQNLNTELYPWKADEYEI